MRVIDLNWIPVSFISYTMNFAIPRVKFDCTVAEIGHLIALSNRPSYLLILKTVMFAPNYILPSILINFIVLRTPSIIQHFAAANGVVRFFLLQLYYYNKKVSISVICLWAGIEPVRLYYGFSGNLKERVRFSTTLARRLWIFPY